MRGFEGLEGCEVKRGVKVSECITVDYAVELTGQNLNPTKIKMFFPKEYRKYISIKSYNNNRYVYPVVEVHKSQKVFEFDEGKCYTRLNLARSLYMDIESMWQQDILNMTLIPSEGTVIWLIDCLTPSSLIEFGKNIPFSGYIKPGNLEDTKESVDLVLSIDNRIKSIVLDVTDWSSEGEDPFAPADFKHIPDIVKYTSSKEDPPYVFVLSKICPIITGSSMPYEQLMMMMTHEKECIDNALCGSKAAKWLERSLARYKRELFDKFNL